VRWSLGARSTDDEHLPAALWLIVTGDGVLSEQPLVPDTQALARGTAGASGAFVLEGAERARRLAGQLWSGPSGALDALPVDGGVVLGCEVR
jgi:hypothetical protein